MSTPDQYAGQLFYEGLRVPQRCPACSAGTMNELRVAANAGLGRAPAFMVAYECGAVLRDSYCPDDTMHDRKVVVGCPKSGPLAAWLNDEAIPAPREHQC